MLALALEARWLCQLDPSHPRFVTRYGLSLNQASLTHEKSG